MERLRAAAAGHRFEHLFTLKEQTGCRIGELLGLRWDKVDWTARRPGGVVSGAIVVDRQLVPPKGRVAEFESPKTARGTRPIFLTRRARTALERQKQRQKADRVRWQADEKSKWSVCTLVFASRYGTPLLEQNVARAFHRLCANARPPLPAEATPHWLRHTAGTRMAEERVEATAIADVLGHADASFTYRTYVHALADRRGAATAALDRLDDRETSDGVEGSHRWGEEDGVQQQQAKAN